MATSTASRSNNLRYADFARVSFFNLRISPIPRHFAAFWRFKARTSLPWFQVANLQILLQVLLSISPNEDKAEICKGKWRLFRNYRYQLRTSAEYKNVNV